MLITCLDALLERVVCGEHHGTDLGDCAALEAVGEHTAGVEALGVGRCRMLVALHAWRDVMRATEYEAGG